MSRSTRSAADGQSFLPFEYQRFIRHVAHVRHVRNEKLTPHQYKELYGKRWYGDAVGVGTSPLHGNGLFATRDIPAWSIATLFPVDFLEHSKTLPDGVIYHFVSTEFSTLGAEPYDILDLRQDLQDYGLVLDGLPNSGLVSFNNMKTTIYGDPTVHRGGELGHFVNDAGCLTPSSSIGDYADYLRTAIEANTIPHILGMYRVAIVTTRDIRAGEELVMSYGESFWTPNASYETAPPPVQQLRDTRNTVQENQQLQCLTSFSMTS